MQPPPPPQPAPPPQPWPPPGAPPPYAGYPPPPYPPPQRPAARSGNGKIIGIVAGALAGVLLLCGGFAVVGVVVAQRAGVFDEADDPADPGGDPPETGPVAWLSMQRDLPALDSLWGELASDFATANDAVVDVETVPRDAYPARIDSGLEFGEPDVFESAGGDQLRDLVEEGLVRDLTDDLGDVIATLSPAVLAPYTIDGRVYGLPYHTAVVGVWYNRSLFADAGLDPDRPPETWAELLAAVDALKDAGITPVAIGGVDRWPLLYWYGCLASRVAGVDTFAGAIEQRSLSANPDYLRAAELLDEFIGSEPFQSGYETASWAGPGGAVELMGTGQAAMEVMGSWAPGVYEAFGDGSVGEDLGWFPFPAVEGGNGAIGDLYGGGDGFAVSSQAPDTAIELLRFLFGDPSYGRILDADQRLIPVRADADPPADPVVARQLEAIQNAPGMQLYLDFDFPPEPSSELTDALGELLAGDATPEEVITRTTDLWQATSD